MSGSLRVLAGVVTGPLGVVVGPLGVVVTGALGVVVGPLGVVVTEPLGVVVGPLGVILGAGGAVVFCGGGGGGGLLLFFLLDCPVNNNGQASKRAIETNTLATRGRGLGCMGISSEISLLRPGAFNHRNECNE